MKKVIIVTGASSGIGKATALQLIQEGHTFYAAARRLAKCRIWFFGQQCRFCHLGAVEEVSYQDAKRQFEVNIFGLAEVTKAVLPSMRQQKKP